MQTVFIFFVAYLQVSNKSYKINIPRNIFNFKKVNGEIKVIFIVTWNYSYYIVKHLLCIVFVPALKSCYIGWFNFTKFNIWTCFSMCWSLSTYFIHCQLLITIKICELLYQPKDERTSKKSIFYLKLHSDSKRYHFF